MAHITKYVVLSHGRSGSVLLASKLGSALKTLPNYVKDNSFDFTILNHSHLFFNRIDLLGCQPVFNLRKNPVMTMLSGIMINHFRVYHRFQDQTFEFEPFVFSDWARLELMIHNYKIWHDRYGKILHPQDLVVYYEDMIANISNINETYRPLYENKQTTIKNYQEVIDFISTHKESLLESQQAFNNHINQVDLYQLLNQ